MGMKLEVPSLSFPPFLPPPQEKRENQAARWWLPSPFSLSGWVEGGEVSSELELLEAQERGGEVTWEKMERISTKVSRQEIRDFCFFVVVLKVLLSVLKTQQTFCQDKKIVDPSTFEGTD